MARQPRLAMGGELHHVLLRGHSGQAVFADDKDRGAFLDMLREAAAQQGVAIHAYVLLDAEVHLLATPQTGEALGRLMQSLGRRYGAAFNRRYGRRGTLWDGRFRTSVLDAETLLLDAMAYIETLPLRTGLVLAAREWPWSSAAHHTGRTRDALVTNHALYWRVGNTPFDRELAHAHLLNQPLQATTLVALAQGVAKGQPLGRAVFVQRIRLALELPLTAPARGRPRRVAANKSVPN